MTIRAVILGLLLGLFVSVATYFNHAIIHQTYLIGNFLPIVIFGVLVVMLLGFNPVLRLIGPDWPLGFSELGVVMAIGLAACAWPGSNFYRVATANVAMPSHWVQTEASWQAAHVMSYVPGASPAIGLGHVQDWQKLTKTLGEGQSPQAKPLAGPEQRKQSQRSKQGKRSKQSKQSTQSTQSKQSKHVEADSGGPASANPQASQPQAKASANGSGQGSSVGSAKPQTQAESAASTAGGSSQGGPNSTPESSKAPPASERAPPSVARAMWRRLPAAARRLVKKAKQYPLSSAEKKRLVKAINDSLLTPLPGQRRGPGLFAVARQDNALPKPAKPWVKHRGSLLRQVKQWKSKRQKLEKEHRGLLKKLGPLRRQANGQAARSGQGTGNSQASGKKTQGEGSGGAQAGSSTDGSSDKSENKTGSTEASESQPGEALAGLSSAQQARFKRLTKRAEAFSHSLERVKRKITSAQARARELGYRANRAVLVDQTDHAVLAPPGGEGLLLARGRPDQFAVDTLLSGRAVSNQLSLKELPWKTWWPTIRLWGGVALLLAMCALCMTLVVHPQWAHRELLTYPIAKFAEEASDRQPGAWLPEVARNRLFWLGLLAPVALHAVNGLHAWFGQVPEIPLDFDFNSLRSLFPHASQITSSRAYFTPTLYLTVVAFAFFLSTSVSFSLGICQLLWTLLGVGLLVSGETLATDYIAAKKGNLIRFGAYAGMAVMIVYVGRRYYFNLLLATFGAARRKDTPRYSVWASRGLLAAILGAVWLLHTAGLAWLMAGLLVVLVLLMFLVITRIVAETGLFFIQAWWMPVAVLSALLGAEAVGPSGYIALGMASIMLVGDPRETLMPFLANGLYMSERGKRASPGKLAPILGVMIVVGFLVAGGVTLWYQYNLGIDAQDGWARRALPSQPFRELTSHVQTMSSEGTLAKATAAEGVGRWSLIKPQSGALLWTAVGLVLVIGAAAARLRIPWWPIHPVLFLVWGTFPINAFAFSFLIGWLVKVAVVRTSGARGYHNVKPLMVGVISGELLMGLVWIAIGAIYYWTTGHAPVSYQIFPG